MVYAMKKYCKLVHTFYCTKGVTQGFSVHSLATAGSSFSIRNSYCHFTTGRLDFIAKI